MEDFILGRIVQCLHDIRPGGSGTCRRALLFCSSRAEFTARIYLGLCFSFGECWKNVNFEKHDVWPWREPRKV